MPFRHPVNTIGKELTLCVLMHAFFYASVIKGKPRKCMNMYYSLYKAYNLYITVGKPIEVEQCDEPDIETMNRVHQQYMEELSQLFDEHKTKYGVNREMKLNFV